MSSLRLYREAPGAYDVFDGAVLIGRIVRDGEPARDDYPWTWVIYQDLPRGVRSTAVADTMRSAAAALFESWRQR